MKTIIFAIAAILSFTQAGARTVIVEKDKCRSGYDKIEESSFEGGINLKCTKAGSSACKTKDGETFGGVSFDSIDASVNEQIESGTTTGMCEFDGGHYSWTTKEDGAVTIAICTAD